MSWEDPWAECRVAGVQGVTGSLTPELFQSWHAGAEAVPSASPGLTLPLPSTGITAQAHNIFPKACF